MRIIKQRPDIRLISWEIKKLYAMPALSIFLLLCLLFNWMIVADSYYDSGYLNYVKEARKTTGSRMGGAFDAQAKKLPPSDYRQTLIDETKGAADIFEQYDPMDTARLLLNGYRIDGWPADALLWKYQQQRQRVQQLDREDVSLDVGAAGMTKHLLDSLFRRLCPAVIAEGILMAVFMALYICGHEQLCGTRPVVCTSRRGRMIQRDKLATGGLCALTVYWFTVAISCLIYTVIWQPGDIWRTSMSTQFYYTGLLSLKLPFIPWKSFTMGTYLAAVLLLGAVTVLIFYISGYCAGLVTRNSYVGFLLVSILSAVNMGLIVQTGNSAQWEAYELLLWSPAALWWSVPLWFTDMGIHGLVPWQECASALFCVAVCSALLLWCFHYFHKKDLY